MCPGADLRTASVLTVNNIEASVRLSLSGMGICYVPGFVVRESLNTGQLKEVLPGSCTRQGVFSALWPASRYLSPRIRCFVDFIGESGLSL